MADAEACEALCALFSFEKVALEAPAPKPADIPHTEIGHKVSQWDVGTGTDTCLRHHSIDTHC